MQRISTYDYIIALREQEQPEVGEHQSPQMSIISSVTGFSTASSVGPLHHGSWCTPPRLFLEDQVYTATVENLHGWIFYLFSL
jgi:palmitoyltransferase ZDHHC1/11